MSAARRTGGRRPGSPDTRGAILAAARDLFARNGFGKTSVRAVAAAAGVDAALVHHYFGTKRALFLETVSVPIDPGTVLAQLASVDLDRLGEQLVLVVGRLWDGELQPAGISLLRENLAAPDAGMLRPFLSDIVLKVLAERIGPGSAADGAEAEVRTSLLATQMLGLLTVRYLVRLEPVASLPIEDVARLVGPTLQRYLTGELRSSIPLAADPAE